jgi:hypothetical protein
MSTYLQAREVDQRREELPISQVQRRVSLVIASNLFALA